MRFGRLGLTTFNVTKVLHKEWDPIGGVPEDEYEEYAEVIVRMLQQKLSSGLIMRYLIESQKTSMKIAPNMKKISIVIETFSKNKWLV